MEKKIKSVKLKAYPNIELRRREREHELGKFEWYSSLATVVIAESRLINFKDSLEIEYEPERKFIDVRIEYDNSSETIIVDERNLQTHFEIKTDLKNIKVTELPEVFTREDMIKFARLTNGNHIAMIPVTFEGFISKRKSNGR